MILNIVTCILSGIAIITAIISLLLSNHANNIAKDSKLPFLKRIQKFDKKLNDNCFSVAFKNPTSNELYKFCAELNKINETRRCLIVSYDPYPDDNNVYHVNINYSKYNDTGSYKLKLHYMDLYNRNYVQYCDLQIRDGKVHASPEASQPIIEKVKKQDER